MSRILAVCLLLSSFLSHADEFLVRVKTNQLGTLAFAQKIEAQGLLVTKIYDLVPGLMRVSGGLRDDETAFNYLNSLSEVLYAEFNHYRFPMIIQEPAASGGKIRPPIPAFVERPVEWKKNSNDTRNFGLYQSRTKEIFEKRKFYGSEKVIIAVLDTGVDYTHRDLTANMWRNPGESGLDNSGAAKESNGQDDDGNGFVDDVMGWDFIHQDGLPFDDYGHGTHVAGIAAAVGGDGLGIAGHCPRCSIMALKFITSDGSGTDADAIEGLEYAAKMGATVINSSWGGEEYSQALFDAFAATSRMGIINSVAAGNSGTDLGFSYPDQFPAEFQLPGLYSIAALYEVNVTIPNWSNYGRPYVHFSMGGAEVYSTMPNNKYEAMSGTSMAAPGAAGIFALMKSYKPSLSFEQITQVLMRAKIPDPRSMSLTNFGGRADTFKAFELLDKL